MQLIFKKINETQQFVTTNIYATVDQFGGNTLENKKTKQTKGEVKLLPSICFCIVS